jgi:hypothetical protein
MSDKFHDVYRLGTAQSLSVNSVAGAVISSSAFGAFTRQIQLCFPGSTSSTGGCRIAIVDSGITVSSTSGTFLPANWVQPYTVTPGQRVSAISNDAGTLTLSITELTD